MRENVLVSQRGQITLPSAMRKRLGIEPGGVVIIEDRQGELVIKPGAVMEVEVYSDAQIKAWDRDDSMTAEEKKSLRKKLADS